MEHEFKFFAIKNPLPNGATVLAFKQRSNDHGVVCARTHGAHEYVTWAVDANSDAYWGHYFKTYDEAIVDWKER
jgi:hypothetical protein